MIKIKFLRILPMLNWDSKNVIEHQSIEKPTTLVANLITRTKNIETSSVAHTVYVVFLIKLEIIVVLDVLVLTVVKIVII